ncbi:4Fe-4S ferredoxin [Candidatus Bathyarchaeota archaeon]|nr:4Fe-4S ferredoxin [Candidatus Bathyarchaeota archaeon]
MLARKIIKIDEAKCNGCGLCIPNCAEGALKIVNEKARLISDKFCDGLGACLGHCPQDAITIEERDAEDFNEEAVKTHLNEQKHASSNNHFKDVPFTCPRSRIIDRRDNISEKGTSKNIRLESELRQWPIQLNLVPAHAPYLKNADLLIAADCVPFSYANFHIDFLRGKTLVMGCPKFDDAEHYIKKLTDILKMNNIKSITLVNMEVPCCFGLQQITEEAIKNSGKITPLRQTIISVHGEKQ